MLVTYTDGTPQTVDQYSQDVSAFLMWAAEPHLVERKRLGFQVLIFLVVFAGPDVPDQEEGLVEGRSLEKQNASGAPLGRI